MPSAYLALLIFVSNCKLYLSKISKYIGLKLRNVFINCEMYLSHIWNLFVSNFKMLLPQIVKCICLFWIVIFTNCKMYLFKTGKMYFLKMATFICSKLQNVLGSSSKISFVTNSQIVLHWISFCIENTSCFVENIDSIIDYQTSKNTCLIKKSWLKVEETISDPQFSLKIIAAFHFIKSISFYLGCSGMLIILRLILL